MEYTQQYKPKQRYLVTLSTGDVHYVTVPSGDSFRIYAYVEDEQGAVINTRYIVKYEEL